MNWQSRSIRRRSRHSLRFEALESRELLALTFGTPLALGGAALLVSGATVDRSGNSYIVGDSSGSVAFGTGPNDTITTANNDLFVAKYNPSHTLIWVKSFSSGPVGTNTFASPKGIAVDALDNAYVVGSFYGGPLNFNQRSAGVDLQANPRAGFVVKLDADGNVAPGMVRSFGGGVIDEALAVSVDPTGTSIFIAGQFQNTVDFNPDGSTGASSISAPTDGVRGFVLKLSANLDFDWVRGGSDLVATSFTSLAVAESGTVYAVGPVDSGGALLVQYNPAGDLTGSARYAEGGGANLFGPLVAVDGAGDPYVAGGLTGSGINFNPDPTTPTTLSSQQYTLNTYLARFDTSLQLTWARRFGSSMTDAASALVVDPAGVASLGGYVTGPASFGTNIATDPVVLTTAVSTTPFISHGFVIQVGPDGTYLQGRTFDPAGTFFKEPAARVDALALQPDGNLLLVGDYEVPFQLDHATLLAPDSSNVFLTTVTSRPSPTLPPVTIAPLQPPGTGIPTPTPTPTPPVVGPIVYNPPPVFFPTVATTFATKTRRVTTAINLAISGDLIPVFDDRFFSIQVRNPCHPNRFGRTLKIKSVSYDATTHLLTLHLIRPHRGAVRVTAAAGAVTSTFGLRSLAAYQTVVR